MAISGMPRLEVFRRDRRRDCLVGLELDDEIDLLLDQVLRVPQRDFRLIPIVDNDELETFRVLAARSRPACTSRGKELSCPCERVADAKPFPRPDHRHEAIVTLVDFFHEPAVMQRVEEAEAHTLPNPVRSTTSRRRSTSPGD